MLTLMKPGSTPLHFAAANGHAPIVQILLTCGAIPDKPDKNGMTPEALAEINGHTEVIRTLRVWEHLQLQESRSRQTSHSGASSERAEPPSPSGSSLTLPDEAEPQPAPSRKGKERALSFASSKSSGGGAVGVRKSLESFLRRGRQGSTSSDAPTPLRISVTSDGSTLVSDKDLASPAQSSNDPDDDAGTDDDVAGPSGLHITREISAGSAGTGGSSTVLALAPPIDDEVSTYEEAIDDTESAASIYLDFQEEAFAETTADAEEAPSQTEDAPVEQPPRIFATIPQEKHPRTSRRPSLPSIFERAVHPGQAFRAAMRRDKHSPEQHSIAEEPHRGFFRGRNKSDPIQRKSGKTIRGLFRRGQSPPSRSPSPPLRPDVSKIVAAEEIDEGIEKIKRASLELERKHSPDLSVPELPPMPKTAPVTKTRFFEDLDESNELRLAALASLAPKEPKMPKPKSPRPRTGSGVLIPSPLANEWAREQSDSDTPTTYPMQRARTDSARGFHASSSRRSLPGSPHPASHTSTKRRSATLPSIPRVAGHDWEEEADLRRVAADGIIRRHSERMMQAAADPTEHPNRSQEAPPEEAHQSSGEDTAQEGDDITPEATPLHEKDEPDYAQSDRGTGRYRGASIGSVTTDSTHLSTPSGSTYPRTTSTVSGDTGSERGYSGYPAPRYTVEGKMPPAPPPSLITALGRPRGKSISSTSSSTSTRGFSSQPSPGTPGTSFSPTSALASAGAPAAFPPVPEHEIAPHPTPQRTVSSRAEARDLVKQNEQDIIQLASLPPSVDSSRSLAAQLAAYGESHALEQEFAAQERRERKQSSVVSDGETFHTAAAEGSDSGSARTKSSSGRTTGSSALQMTVSRQRCEYLNPASLTEARTPAPPLAVDAPKSSVPSINSIYDKRANAYRERMMALTAIQPVLPSSVRNDSHGHHDHLCPRAVTSPTSSSYLETPGGFSGRRYSSSSSQFDPDRISVSIPASLSMTVSAAQTKSDTRTRRAKTGASKYTLHPQSPPGSQPDPSSSSSARRPTSSHRSHPHRRATSPTTSYATAPPPIADVLQTRFQGLQPHSSSASSIMPSSNPPMSSSPFVSIFSSRYSGHPHDGGESDDTDEEPQRYTVIENDWRGGHVVDPAMGVSGDGLRGKKRWGLKGVGFGRKAS